MSTWYRLRFCACVCPSRFFCSRYLEAFPPSKCVIFTGGSAWEILSILLLCFSRVAVSSRYSAIVFCSGFSYSLTRIGDRDKVIGPMCFIRQVTFDQILRSLSRIISVLS